jgi:hypothetical protein
MRLRIVFFVIITLCTLPALAAPPSALIFIENPPSKIMVGEQYAFYVRVQNISKKSLFPSIQFTIRDNNIDLDDVGIAKDTAVKITIIPPQPPQATNNTTTSTAVCEWGELKPDESAKCAFYISALGATIDKIPFVISARDVSTNETLASYIYNYRVLPGEYPTRYDHYRDSQIQKECAEFSKTSWTPEFGACYSEAQRKAGKRSYPLHQKIIDQ